MGPARPRSCSGSQTRPVEVVFTACRGTPQAHALKLVAQKRQSSLAVEGDRPSAPVWSFFAFN